MKKIISFLLLSILLASCNGKSNFIVTGIDEREANIIIVFLESKGIKAYKEVMSSGPTVGAEAANAKFNIHVDSGKTIEAMAILNSNGLPRRQGVNLLELFSKSGMMTTDKEETIRYQAGLTSQITNMILLIDGVIDANVQISFPQQDVTGSETAAKPRVTASVFVKHQGIIDDPHSHLEIKIKRLIAGSIQDLNISDVTVVSDRSRFTDVEINQFGEPIESKAKEYVKIWSIIMSEGSTSTFRIIFFSLLIVALILAITISWIIWKIYPIVFADGGFKQLFSSTPFSKKKSSTDNSQSNEES